MPKTIVIVDDERSLNDLLSKALSGRGYRTLSAYNGKEAIEIIKDKLPELILLDVMLPDMTGFQVLEKIKEDERTKNIPVVMLTQKSLLKDVELAIDLGALRYIIKPFDIERLFATVKDIIGE